MLEESGEVGFDEMRLNFEPDQVDAAEPAVGAVSAANEAGASQPAGSASDESTENQTIIPDSAPEREKYQTHFAQAAVSYQQAHQAFISRFARFRVEPDPTKPDESEFNNIARGFNKQTLNSGDDYQKQLDDFLIELKQIRQENTSSQMTVADFVDAIDGAELANISTPDELQGGFLEKFGLELPAETSFEDYLAQNPALREEFVDYQQALEQEFKDTKKSSLGEKLLRWGVDWTNYNVKNGSMNSFIDAMLIMGVYNSRSEILYPRSGEVGGNKVISANDFKNKLNFQNRITTREKKETWMKVSGALFAKLNNASSSRNTLEEWGKLESVSDIKRKMSDLYLLFLTKAQEGKQAEVDQAFKMTFSEYRAELGLESWKENEIVGSELIAFFQALSTQENIIVSTFNI